MRKWRFIFCAALCLCLAACGERLTLPDYTPLDEAAGLLHAQRRVTGPLRGL